MSDIVVRQLSLINKEVEYVKPINNSTTVYTFLITDVVSSNPKYSIAVAMRHQLGKEASAIRDIGAGAEYAILRVMGDDIRKDAVAEVNDIRKNDEKKLVVIELTNYPYITSYIDYRDQSKLFEGDTDQFSKDVVHVWNSQTSNQLPVIIVNIADMKNVHTGLKFLNID